VRQRRKNPIAQANGLGWCEKNFRGLKACDPFSQMPQSLASLLIHLVLSTKNREPLLADDMAAEIHPYCSVA
jgi:hypothetical protein